MKKIEGFLIGAYPKGKVSEVTGERILFGSGKGRNGFMMFGWGGFESVFQREEEAKEALSSFSKKSDYKKVELVKIRMKIPEKEREETELKRRGSFVIIHSPFPNDRKLFGPFSHNLSGAFDGRAGHFMGNGWRTFSSRREARKIEMELSRGGFCVNLACLRLFSLNGEELTKPEEREDMLEFLDLAEIN